MFFFVFMNIIFWAVWWPSAMDQWHRVAATKSAKKALSKGFGTLSFGSVLYLAILTFTFLAAGSMIKVLIEPEIGGSQPLFYLLSGIMGGLDSVFGWVILGIIAVGFVAVLISTIDTYLVVAGQSYVSDIYLARKSKKTLAETNETISAESQKKLLKFSSRTILFFILPVGVLFFLISQLADVFTSIYFFFAFMMAAIPALFIGLVEKHKEENANAAYWGLVVGGIWALITNLYLILTINNMLVAGLYNEVLTYYNFLYANPAITAVVALIVTLIVTLKNKVLARKIHP